MKKIAIVLILLLVPIAATGFFFGQSDMLGISHQSSGGGGCGVGYTALTGSDTNAISDATGGSICCPD